jgi:hypothetical protein
MSKITKAEAESKGFWSIGLGGTFEGAAVAV